MFQLFNAIWAKMGWFGDQAPGPARPDEAQATGHPTTSPADPHPTRRAARTRNLSARCRRRRRRRRRAATEAAAADRRELVALRAHCAMVQDEAEWLAAEREQLQEQLRVAKERLRTAKTHLAVAINCAISLQPTDPKSDDEEE